jgi:oxygen-dependent protoporphyrinogen oxidase
MPAHDSHTPGKAFPRVAVIGGGIAGLAAAHHLRELAVERERPLEVALFEAGERLGGALETIRRDGFVLETGADSFLSEKPAALRLAERLGLAREVIGTQEQFRKTFVVRGGRLVEIPEGFSMIAPSYFGPLLRSRLFSPRGKARILLEPLIPRRRAAGDESLAAFVTRRLGRETLERVAQPLAGGIYTADPAQLSVTATMPRFVEMERRYGSVIRGLRAVARNRGGEARGTSGARWSLFVSFRGGIGVLSDALAGRIRDSIHARAPVVALARGADDGRRWHLELPSGESYAADAIISAAPAYEVARLIAPHNPQLAARLGEISYASAATVNLAFHARAFPLPLRSFGFVVPLIERRRIIAGSFSSLKFEGRAPADAILARVFIGGALQSEMVSLDDTAMIAAAREELGALLGVTEAPQFFHVRRWPRAMPQYAVGHLARVAEIEREAAQLEGFALAGAFLNGVGIPDCVRSGESAAAAIFTHVTRDG